LGGKHTTARAGEICAKALAEYQQPLMDEAVRAELEGSSPAAAPGLSP
jgi:trimethylamine:corrinoid methyltransferase-like protein